jgi:fluoride ion exporter CrcB/FEX
MVDHGRLGLAALYIGTSLALGFLCVRLGIALERRPGVASS